jgi:hypothetical protein
LALRQEKGDRKELNLHVRGERVRLGAGLRKSRRVRTEAEAGGCRAEIAYKI